MDNTTVLVLADPADPQLALLEQLPNSTSLAVGRHLDAFERAAADADVIFNWSGKLDLFRQVFSITPRVKWIHSRAAGLDGVLFPELIASTVPLTNGRGVFSQSLGEFVVAAALYFAKDFRRMIRNQEAGRWEQFDVEEVSMQTMGIVGYGDIGKACAQRAKALGMKVLAARRRPELSKDDPNIDEVHGFDGIRALMPRCDYVVAAAPLTPETRGMVGAKEIAAMKPSAVVMNVGRGPVVDEAALVAALKEKRIRGAALDVFDTEPLPEGHPYYQMESVLLSPHSADHTKTWLDDAMRFFLTNFERYQSGQPLLNVVDKNAGY